MVASLIRWWPVLGLSVMTLLGLVVGTGTTPLDSWFTDAGTEHPVLGRLLFFTDPRVLAVLLGSALVVALVRRRWLLAVVAAVLPFVGVAGSRLLKHVFGREKGEMLALAYPSGHVTTTVVVVGVLVIALGLPTWAVVAAALWTVPAMLGQAFTHHYFTDTVGAVLLATSLLAPVVWAVELDRCQPGCDVRHTHG